MKALNLNDVIKVKLTDFGKKIYYHQYDELNELIKKNGGNPIKPKFPKVDENDYSEFQLWDFMYIYGGYMKMGFGDNGIKGLTIYIDEKDLEEV